MADVRGLSRGRCLRIASEQLLCSMRIQQVMQSANFEVHRRCMTESRLPLQRYCVCGVPGLLHTGILMYESNSNTMIFPVTFR